MKVRTSTSPSMVLPLNLSAAEHRAFLQFLAGLKVHEFPNSLQARAVHKAYWGLSAEYNREMKEKVEDEDGE